MSLDDTEAVVLVVCGLAIVAGLAGVVVPGLPALPLCWGGVAVWAVFGSAGWGRWLVLAAATGVALIGAVAKFAWPGRNLKRAGVPSLTLLAGAVLGLVGFFVIPVVGLVLGFVAGVWLAEWSRLRETAAAWPSTRRALAAAGLAMMIELAAGLSIAALWVTGLLFA